MFLNRKIISFIVIVILGLTHPIEANSPPSSIRWVVYYTDKAPIEAFEAYDICVFDSLTHPPLIPLKQDKKTLLGYVSLGEVEQYRPYFKDVKEQNLFIKENPNWKGSYYVDLRNPLWAKRVIEEIIPRLIRKGFDGIFMDTLDNAEFLEDTDPVLYKGMKEAAINLVKAIRQNYPTLKIMMNRGFQILPKLVNVIDMEMGEVIYTHYNFKTKKYNFQPIEEQNACLKALQEAQKSNPHLQVFTLDYWNKNDPKGIAKIYKRQRENGFIPYVATIKLNEIIPEPESQHEKKAK